MKKVFDSDLRERRNNANMTLQQTADAIGKSKDYVWRVESGQTCPSVDTLTDIANLFGGLRAKKDGMIILIVPEGDFEKFTKTLDEESRSKNGKGTIPSDSGLSLGDKAQRLSLEAGELRDIVDGLARYIPSILQGRDEGLAKLVEVIKEADDLTEWGLAFRSTVQENFPDQYKAARAIIEDEFAQEFGESAA